MDGISGGFEGGGEWMFSFFLKGTKRVGACCC
jgi:hypothetical protein